MKFIINTSGKIRLPSVLIILIAASCSVDNNLNSISDSGIDIYTYLDSKESPGLDIEYLDYNEIQDVLNELFILDEPDISNIQDNGLNDTMDIITEDNPNDTLSDDISLIDIQDILIVDSTDTHQCVDLCRQGQFRCRDESTLEICSDFNMDGCMEYGFYKTCENRCIDNTCQESECLPVQLTSPEPVIPSESRGGRYETTKVDGFNDDYIYNATNYTKIGIRREWGGSIIFFGLSNGRPGMNPTNTIDANDTGREVQVAFYDPDRIMQNCAYNASCAITTSTCPNSITFLGWNPVQGGNRCNIGSGVEFSKMEDEYLTISTIPLQWNPDWDRTDCDSSGCTDPSKRYRRSDVRVVQKIRFITKHVVELDYTVINLSNIEHRETAQEMPTMYTSNGKNGTQDLYKLFDSDGNLISIDQAAGNDGFYYKNFKSSGGWVAMQNDALNYGVGIYYENKIKDFQGWQLRSLPFNNVRAIFSFGIPANGTIRARAYLSLGNYDTIRAEFTELDRKLGPFGNIDIPINKDEVSGDITISGWALDNKGVNSVYAVIDKDITIPLNYGVTRHDVCKIWPGYKSCNTNNVGFHGTYNVSQLTKCPHLLEVYAKDEDNNVRRIGSKIFIVK
ncbi:MAG: hypothetical protein N2746_11980 [Deltaproteobacteria bacterium]|nr:hypothetical protein [Deltaproteobacteria bacterium]